MDPSDLSPKSTHGAGFVRGENKTFVLEREDPSKFQLWKKFVLQKGMSLPEGTQPVHADGCLREMKEHLEQLNQDNRSGFLATSWMPLSVSLIFLFLCVPPGCSCTHFFAHELIVSQLNVVEGRIFVRVQGIH
jgi:hypothetical protein